METGRTPDADPLHARKVQAAEQMEAAARVVAAERLRRGIPIDPDTDPNRTGLIGPEYTPITTTLGHLGAKRTSTNPNMAGLIVHLLGQAGASRGRLRRGRVLGVLPGAQHRGALRARGHGHPAGLRELGRGLDLRGHPPRLHLARHGAGPGRPPGVPVALGCGRPGRDRAGLPALRRRGAAAGPGGDGALGPAGARRERRGRRSRPTSSVAGSFTSASAAARRRCSSTSAAA